MTNMEFQAKRIKFTVRKFARERLFSLLQDANECTRKLLESSDQITVARHQSQAVKAASMANCKLSEFWRHAKRLHEALSTPWQCGCAKHTANLGFQHRTFERIELDMLFHIDNDHKEPRWRGTRVKMVANETAVSVDGPKTIGTSNGHRVRFDIA
jgi:hypothetical protein